MYTWRRTLRELSLVQLVLNVRTLLKAHGKRHERGGNNEHQDDKKAIVGDVGQPAGAVGVGDEDVH